MISLSDTQSTARGDLPTLAAMASHAARLTQRRAIDLCRVAGCLCCGH
jgi:hypothetical protein